MKLLHCVSHGNDCQYRLQTRHHLFTIACYVTTRNHLFLKQTERDVAKKSYLMVHCWTIRCTFYTPSYKKEIYCKLTTGKKSALPVSLSSLRHCPPPLITVFISVHWKFVSQGQCHKLAVFCQHYVA